MSADNFIKLFKEEDGKFRGYMGFASEDTFEKGQVLFECDTPEEAEFLAGQEYTEYGWHWENWSPAQEINPMNERIHQLEAELVELRKIKQCDRCFKIGVQDGAHTCKLHDVRMENEVLKQQLSEAQDEIKKSHHALTVTAKQLSDSKNEVEAVKKLSDANNLLLEKYKTELDEWKCPRCKSAKEHDDKLRDSKAGMSADNLYDIICIHLNSIVTDLKIMGRGDYFREFAKNLAQAIHSAWEKKRGGK